jgi:co-chaperonin GroES (HSP10)
MKSMLGFVVEIPKKLNDTVTLGNGVEIYMETKFDEFRHRTTKGTVVCLPAKHETDVQIGDTLYFHHLVVINGGTPLPGFEDCYSVRYDPENPTSSHAIAYTPKGSDDIVMLSKWCLLEEVEEEEEVQSDIIETVKLYERPTSRAVIFKSFEGSRDEFGVEEGDVVGIRNKSDYRIVINDVEYYRTRPHDMLYVEEEVHND